MLLLPLFHRSTKLFYEQKTFVALKFDVATFLIPSIHHNKKRQEFFILSLLSSFMGDVIRNYPI